MQHTRVVSINLYSIGYDYNTNILEIQFNSDELYEYSDVPSRIYEGFISAVSHDKYFRDHISNVYPCRRIN